MTSIFSIFSAGGNGRADRVALGLIRKINNFALVVSIQILLLGKFVLLVQDPNVLTATISLLREWSATEKNETIKFG